MSGTQKILSSKEILKEKLFTVLEDKIVSHHGTEHTFYSVHADSAVGIIPITSNGEIYLIDQYRYLFEKRLLGIVAGHIDEGETPLKAAQRELKEEAGITAAQWELLAKTEISRSVLQQTYHFFLAKDLEISTQNLMDDEDIIVVKMPLPEAVEKILTGEIYHSQSVAGILLLSELKRRKQL